MTTHARGLFMAARSDSSDTNDEARAKRASTLVHEHGAVLARVCMALLGDAAAAQSALERVAREATGTAFEEGKNPLPRLLGLARAACANQLSKVPLRATAAWGEATKPKTERDGASDAQRARAAIGKLKPTEREAVVLHLVGALDAAQVAEACGVDLATARQRIARGISQLTEQEKNK
jgi:RNA polymerase sigma-70 factor (ECF subfamily)